MWRTNIHKKLFLSGFSQPQLRVLFISLDTLVFVPARTKIVGSSTISYKEHLVQRNRDYKSPPRYVIKAWTRVERGYSENVPLRLDGFIPAILMRPAVAPFTTNDLIPFYVQRLKIEWMKKWRSPWVSSVLHEIRVLQAVVEREVALENAMTLVASPPPPDTVSVTHRGPKRRQTTESEGVRPLPNEKELLEKLKAQNIPLPPSLQPTAPWRALENDPLFQQLVQAKDQAGKPIRYGFEALWRKVKYIKDKLLPQPPEDYDTLMRDLGRTEPPCLDDMAHWFPTPSPQRPPLLLKLRPGPIRAHQVHHHFLGRRYWLDVVDLNERYEVVPQQMTVDIFHFHPRSIVFRLWDPRTLPRHCNLITTKYDPIEYFAPKPVPTPEEAALIDACRRIVDVWIDLNPFGTEFDDPKAKHLPRPPKEKEDEKEGKVGEEAEKKEQAKEKQKETEKDKQKAKEKSAKDKERTKADKESKKEEKKK